MRYEDDSPAYLSPLSSLPTHSPPATAPLSVDPAPQEGPRPTEAAKPAEVDPDTPPPSLTPREVDVLVELAKGLRYREVAGALGVSINTVRTHVRAAYSKLSVKTKEDAYAEAARLGFVPPLGTTPAPTVSVPAPALEVPVVAPFPVAPLMS